jgi:hypothetical protein
MQRYCPDCTTRRGLRPGEIDRDRLLDSVSQQQSQVKHSSASSTPAVQSVFDSSNTAYYKESLMEAVTKGSAETDGKYQLNFVHCPSAGSTFATKYHRGLPVQRVDTLRAVQAWSPSKVHLYAESALSYVGLHCDDCGEPFLPGAERAMREAN